MTNQPLAGVMSVEEYTLLRSLVALLVIAMSRDTVSNTSALILRAGPHRPAVVHEGSESACSTLTVADIEVQPLSRDQWRLRDRRTSRDDTRGLLGFVEKIQPAEKTSTVFELMTLTHGFEWFSFSSLQEAITHVARHASEPASGHRGDAFAWIS